MFYIQTNEKLPTLQLLNIVTSIFQVNSHYNINDNEIHIKMNLNNSVSNT